MLDRIIRFIGFLFFGIAVWLIAKEVHLVGWPYLWHTLLKTPPEMMIAVLGVILINYLILSGYDLLALRYVGCKLPYPKVLEVSGISFAFSNTTGHTYAAGGAIRYLFYVPEGISPMNVLKIVIFETLSIFIGIVVSFLVAFLFHFTGSTLSGTHLSEINGLAVLMIILCLLYYAFIMKKNRTIKWGNLSVRAPSKKETMRQILVGLGDNMTLFLCFYIILDFFVPTPITTALTVFMIAEFVGFATQVPGGLGVFEGTFLTLFPHTIEQKAGILASLVLFRVFYYFLPFVLAALYLGIRFIRQKIS